MTADQYRELSDVFRTRPKFLKFFHAWNKITTATFYFAYALLLALIVLRQTADAAFLTYAILAPGFGFVLVSALRKAINAPRPYEVLDIDPLIKKDTVGQSFPSKHTYSAFVISVCWWFYCWPVGLVLTLIALDIACIRVVGGVHFPRDVIWAAVIGLAFGLVGALFI